MRSIEEIYQALLTTFAQRVGFTPEEGCDLPVRLWAAAAQIQALEIQADWVLDQSFPQTAQGIYLDRHGAMRNISRLPATKAVGSLRFSVEFPPAMDANIPAQTVCMTKEGVRFQTIGAAVLAAGELFVDVPAEALEGGAAGNAAPGEISILTACPVAITACTNPEAFSGGSDQEDDETLRERILESYRRLPNGANAAWYEQTAMNYGGVAAARAVGRPRGIGTVDVYVTTEEGLPGEELLTGLQAELQEKREIAVDVQVKAPQVGPVDIAVSIAPAEGVAFSDAKDAAEQLLTAFFTGRLLGTSVRLAELGNQLFALPEVANYRFSAPTEDLTGDDIVLPVLGTLTVTEMEM